MKTTKELTSKQCIRRMKEINKMRELALVEKDSEWYKELEKKFWVVSDLLHKAEERERYSI